MKSTAENWTQTVMCGHAIQPTILVGLALNLAIGSVQSQTRILMCLCVCALVYFVEPGANLEISNFLRSHFDNEVNLNSGGSFASTCADYQSTTQHNCRPDTLCAFDGERKKFTCNGRIVGCSRIDDKLTICPTVN